MVKEGKEDFLACATPKNVCEKFQHQGQKANYYMDLPLTDSPVLAIKVRSTSQTVSLRVFSQPSLPLTSFPVEFRDDARINILTSLTFYARVWKVLLEAHKGFDWMTDLAYSRTGSLKCPPPLNIPSPRVG